MACVFDPAVIAFSVLMLVLWTAFVYVAGYHRLWERDKSDLGEPGQ